MVPFLRFGEAISGGPRFPFTPDALKKVFTGQASHEVLLSIAHVVRFLLHTNFSAVHAGFIVTLFCLCSGLDYKITY